MIARVAILALLAAVPGQAPQRPQLDRGSFNRWIAEGPREEIPWRVKVSGPELHLDQRLRVTIEVTLSRTSLNRHGSQHDLVLLTRLRQTAGEWLAGTSRLAHRLDEPLARGTSLIFTVQVLLIPGEYNVGLVLFDRVSGHRSVTLQPLRVDAVRADPLPQSVQQLPAVEFVRAEEGLDAVYQPRLAGHLRLPVETRRPVQVELLVNFGHSEEFTVPVVRAEDLSSSGRIIRRRRPSPQQRRSPDVERNSAMILEALKPLANLSMRNGSLRITGLDLARRQLIFQQDLAQPLDWPRLREALSAFSSSVVSAQTLVAQKENPRFFREFLEQRLGAAPSGFAAGPGSREESATAATGAPGQRPVRIFVVLSSAMLFARGAEVSPVTPPEACHCRVYHIRLHLLGHLWDQLGDILAPLEPRRFEVRSPMDYRRTLAAILDDLRQL